MSACMLINCGIPDYTISASGSIAIASQACLPSDVIIPALIVASFFDFVSDVEAFNFDVLLFCLLPSKGTLSFTFLFTIFSSRVTIALIDCLAQMLSFYHNLYKIVCPHYLYNCHMPKKLCRYFVKCIVFYTSSLLIFHTCFCKHFPYSSCEKSISDLKFKK